MKRKMRSSAAAAAAKAQTSPSASKKHKRHRSQPQNVIETQPQNVMVNFMEKERVEKERVEKLVEGFGKNFLVFLVMEAISKDPDFIHSLCQKADEDPAQRLVCAYTYDKSVTGEALKSFFGEFGEIESFGTQIGFGTVSVRILFKLRKVARAALLKVARTVVHDPVKKIGTGILYCELFSSIPATPMFTSENESMIPSFQSFRPSMINCGDEDEEPVMQFVQSFGEHYLMDFVKEAISKIPNFIKIVEEQADLDPVQRQVYVFQGIGIDHPFLTHDDGGLEVLQSECLDLYGEIEYCQVEEQEAIVQFKHRSSVLKLMELPNDDNGWGGVRCKRYSNFIRKRPVVD